MCTCVRVYVTVYDEAFVSFHLVAGCLPLLETVYDEALIIKAMLLTTDEENLRASFTATDHR